MEKMNYFEALQAINRAIARLRNDKNHDIGEEEKLVRSAIADLTKHSSIQNSYIARYVESELRFSSTIWEEWG